MRVEDLTKFEGECPNIVVFGTYMDIRVPLTKKWKKIINERGDKPNTYHNCLISYISEQIAYNCLTMIAVKNPEVRHITNVNVMRCLTLTDAAIRNALWPEIQS